ncbi:MAG: Ada metal-binding domain-containing protein [Clostridiales bacterium]
MSEDAKWAAVSENDSSFDGVFFYGVKTTGIFCRPSCKSKVPRRENVRFFDSAGQARQEGFRPCKRCRPDLLSYQPLKELAEKAKDLIDSSIENKLALANELRNLGLTQHRLAELFRDHYGLTISEYSQRVRLEKARVMLAATREPIANIAFDVGFESLSAFYRFFRKQTGMTPSAYRQTCQPPTGQNSANQGPANQSSANQISAEKREEN